MGRPQQEELARSGRTDLDPDHAETRIGGRGHRAPRDEGTALPVPEENEPGHRPEREQDKPDPEAVARRLGTRPPADRARPTRTATALGTAAGLPLRTAAGAVGGLLRLVERLQGR